VTRQGNEDTEAARAVYHPLTQCVRTLIDTLVRTEVDLDTARSAHAHVQKALDLLGEKVMPGSFGTCSELQQQGEPWGNVVIGLRNPIALPLNIVDDSPGHVSADMHVGAAYEGPAGHVHGGVCSAVLDHVLSAAAYQPGRPVYTGTLQLTFARPTPLGDLRAEAWVEHESGRKTYVRGRLLSDGHTTVEAQGIFIRPAD
jgi:acyl-coenzyme A thioesterase PaaI-like protein